jgi:hypothetical protein
MVRATVAASALAVSLLAGCDSALEVENVTAIEADDVRNAESAELWANGSLIAVQEGWDAMLLLLSAASDELRFVGQFAWWDELDRGDLTSPDNAGLNEVFPSIGAAQWFAEEAIGLLDSLNQAGELVDPEPLARAYLYGAIIYPTLADGMEDYAPSDLTEAGPPLGPDNMVGLYDSAIDFATAGLALQPGGDLERDLLAARARARHARQVWQRIRPPPADVSGEGFVADAEAAADARAALAVDPSDWRLEFDFPLFILLSRTAEVTNCLVSMRFGDRYVYPTADNQRADSVRLRDPIDDVPDPTVDRVVFQIFQVPGPCPFKTLTVLSAQEMHLIAAEDALAGADTATFAAAVNQVRAFEGLTAWSAASGVTARDMLIHERQARLFLTGRRLGDLYRFDIDSDSWDPESVAATEPGTLYPIPRDEINANCYLNGSCG